MKLKIIENNSDILSFVSETTWRDKFSIGMLSGMIYIIIALAIIVGLCVSGIPLNYTGWIMIPGMLYGIYGFVEIYLETRNDVNLYYDITDTHLHLKTEYKRVRDVDFREERMFIQMITSHNVIPKGNGIILELYEGNNLGFSIGPLKKEDLELVLQKIKK